jgi:hypothetical protein
VSEELPAGWRITTDFEGFAGSIDTVYLVQRWMTWKVRKRWWHWKKVNRTGWRTLYSDHFDYKAKQWAHDTIKALQETSKGTH